jgi:hypothetical protein
MMKYCDREKYLSQAFDGFTPFSPHDYERCISCMPSTCKYEYYICPLAPELLEGLHSYSVPKSLSIQRRFPVNLDFSLQNIGTLQTHNSNFLENGHKGVY